MAVDMAESYDVAPLHPEIVSELMTSLEEQMPSFPANVVEAYTKLKEHKGDISTPPAASPRPDHVPVGSGLYTPPYRQEH